MIHKFILIGLLFSTLLFGNGDRALYLKKYGNEGKVALIIGNSNYDNQSLSRLKNPINDARAVRDKLKEKNFEVLYLEDATQKEIDKEVRKFSDKLKNSGVGLFYFAGHGLEVDKKNYLIPLGAKISDEVDVKYEALEVNKIVDYMKKSGTRLNLVILDACRNNPFKRGAGGLAPMENANGTLIAYATDSGSTASDNPNDSNGLFTKYFLDALGESEALNQREFFHKIRKNVHEASRGNQLPYLNDGTIGDFYFNSDGINSQKSSLKLQDEVQEFYSLSIKTTPPDAKIQISNLSSDYYDGIKLKHGRYEIKVSKDGYIAKTGIVELKSNLSTLIELQKENIVFDTQQTNFAKSTSVQDLYKLIKSNQIEFDSNKVILSTPDIAENGSIVPMSIDIRHSNEIGNVYIFSDANQDPFVASFESLSRKNRQEYALRIRMEKTGNIYVVYEYNGKYYMSSKNTKVTIGNYGAPYNSNNKPVDAKIKCKDSEFKMMFKSDMAQNNYIQSVVFRDDSNLLCKANFTSNMSQDPFLKFVFDVSKVTLETTTKNNERKSFECINR